MLMADHRKKKKHTQGSPLEKRALERSPDFSCYSSKREIGAQRHLMSKMGQAFCEQVGVVSPQESGSWKLPRIPVSKL